MKLTFAIDVEYRADGDIDTNVEVTDENGNPYAGFGMLDPMGTTEETVDYLLHEIRALLRHHPETCGRLDHTACCGKKKICD